MSGKGRGGGVRRRGGEGGRKHPSILISVKREGALMTQRKSEGEGDKRRRERPFAKKVAATAYQERVEELGTTREHATHSIKRTCMLNVIFPSPCFFLTNTTTATPFFFLLSSAPPPSEPQCTEAHFRTHTHTIGKAKNKMHFI